MRTPFHIKQAKTDAEQLSRLL